MATLRRMLVPLDGSPMAEAALPVAVGLAQPLGAGITLLHVQERGAPRTIHGQSHLQEPSEAVAYLADVQRRWQTPGLTIDWHVHPNPQGDVARSIVEHAEEMGADLVVLTTHGSGGLRDFLFGSIAQQVLRRGARPTLIVRPHEDTQVVPYHPHAILIPLDGGHAAEEALDLAQAIASATGATLVLASVIPTVATASGDLAAVASFTPSATAEMLDQAEAVAGRYLAEQAEPMRQHGREVRTSVTRGRASAQLAAVAAANGVDLVVLATHGRAGLEGVLSGSVGQRLLARLHAPVLLLKLTEPAS